MFKIGDKIKVGNAVGEITQVYIRSRIGFNVESEVSYDILLRDIPEKTITQKEDGTD